VEIFEAAVKAFPQYKKADIRKYYRLFISKLFKNRFKTLFAADGVQLTPYDLTVFDGGWNFNKELFDIE
jgi:hypothetical protein